MLLARWRGPTGPSWTLTGGGLDFGEHPEIGASRELTEETGYTGELESLLGVDVDHCLGVHGDDTHSVRVVYRARVTGGELTNEVDGSTDLAECIEPERVRMLAAVPLVEAGIAMLDRPGTQLPRPAAPAPVPTSRLPRVVRIAAYGLAVDADDAVLLVRAAPRTTWPSRWFLPGGGLDHGERPEAAVAREFVEETGLSVDVDRVRRVASDVVDSLAGGVQQWTVRLVYDVRVVGGELRNEIGGTTDATRWVPRSERSGLQLMPFVRETLGV